MKSLKSWRLVGPGTPDRAPSRRNVSTCARGGFAVLRGTAGDFQRTRPDPGLTDRINRISTYVLAAKTLNSFRFGGSYDRA